jgi:hypothetical protein
MAHYSALLWNSLRTTIGKSGLEMPGLHLSEVVPRIHQPPHDRGTSGRFSRSLLPSPVKAMNRGFSDCRQVQDCLSSLLPSMRKASPSPHGHCQSRDRIRPIADESRFLVSKVFVLRCRACERGSVYSLGQIVTFSLDMVDSFTGRTSETLGQRCSNDRLNILLTRATPGDTLRS